MRKRSVGTALLATVPLILMLTALAFWVITAMSLRVRGALGVVPLEVIQQTSDEIVSDLKQGKTEQADALFNQMVNMAGGSSEAYTALASEIIKDGRPADAARYLTTATGKNDVNWDPMFWATLAEAQNKVSDTKQSEQSRAEAERRAEAFVKAGAPKMSGAKPAVQDRINRLDQVAEYYAEVKKEPAQAIALLEEALRLDENVLTLNALGYILADKGMTPEEFDRALTLTKKAVDQAPGSPVILDSYGWALFKKNDLAGARRVLREAVDDAPMIAEIHYHLGVVYAQLGLTTDATREFDRALVLDPDNDEVLQKKKLLKQPPGKGIVEKA